MLYLYYIYMTYFITYHTLIITKANIQRSKKRKQCPCKPSSVLAEASTCHLSSPKVTLGLKHSTLHSSPKAIGRAALKLRYT